MTSREGLRLAVYSLLEEEIWFLGFTFSIIADLRYLLDYHISNAIVSSQTGLASVGEKMASRRTAVFRHIARLGEEVSALEAVSSHVDLSLSRLPGWDWKRCPGQPNNRWVDQYSGQDGLIRFVTTPATCPRRYGDQPFSMAMAQE